MAEVVVTTSNSPSVRGGHVSRSSSAVGSVPRVLVFMEAREFGGPAKNLVATSKLLAGAVDFRVVTFIRGQASSTEFTQQLNEHGVDCAVVRERFRYDPRGLSSVRQIVKSYRPDIVQIHNGKSRLYLYILRRMGLLRKLPTIDCYHGETWTDTKQLAYNKLDRWLFRRARNVIVVSQRQVRLLEEFGVPQDRITVIYNGIRLHDFSPRVPDTQLNIITVGRLSREKGHNDLLAAIRILHERGVSGFKLTVVGDGPEIESLKSRVTQYDIGDIVEFTGYQPDPTPYYETADLFVLPSLTEGIPNVLLEAAIHYVPIVSTSVGGVPEMFDQGREAVLVPPAQADALADGMGRCLNDAPFRHELAMAARARVESQFTDDHRAQHYLDYYNRLISRST